MRATYLLLLFFLSGCSSRPPQWPAARARFDGWTLTTESPKGHLGSYLANGFLGLRTGPLGVGEGPDATRFASIAGVYHHEKIACIPDWNHLDLFNGKRWFSEEGNQPSIPGGLREDERPVRPDIRDYSQTLDLKRGVLTTRFTWGADRRPLKVQTETFLSRARPGIADVRLTLQSDSDLTIQARFSIDHSQAGGDVLDASTETRYSSASGQAGSLSGITQVITRVQNGDRSTLIAEKMGLLLVSAGNASIREIEAEQKSEKSAHRTFEIQCRKGQPVAIERIISIAVGGKDASARADRELEKAYREGFDKLLEEHTGAWEKMWQSDIEIEGDEEAQRVARTALFFLYSSAHPGSGWSLPPMGLSSDVYGGHIFWDAEIWMYPVLLLLQPDMAREMLEYRLDRLPAARQYAKGRGLPGADFPWESAATGLETAPQEFAQERHITADVAWAVWQYYLATGDKEWLSRRAWPLLRDTADFWAGRAAWNPGKKRYEIRKVMTPDETAGVVDNSAWTNAMAQANLRIAAEAARIVGQPAPAKWKDIADKIWIPFDTSNNRYLEHDRYQGQTTKQADAELLIFPRSLPMPQKVKEATFDYYASKASKYGPAMTSSIHAIIAAELGRKEEACRYFQESYRPFLRPAFDLFSEKRTTDVVHFLTGAGGMLQSLLWGFGGIRIEGEQLQAKPLLPPSWQKLTIRGIHWRGKCYRLEAEARKTGRLAEELR